MSYRFHSECNRRSSYLTSFNREAEFSPSTRSPSPFQHSVRRTLFAEEEPMPAKPWAASVRCSKCFLLESDLAKATARNRCLEDEVQLLRRNQTTTSSQFVQLQARIDRLSSIESECESLALKNQRLESDLNRRLSEEEHSQLRIRQLEQDQELLSSKNRQLELELARKRSAEDSQRQETVDRLNSLQAECETLAVKNQRLEAELSHKSSAEEHGQLRSRKLEQDCELLAAKNHQLEVLKLFILN